MSLPTLVDLHKIAAYDRYRYNVKQTQRMYGELCGDHIYEVLHDFIADFFLNVCEGAKLVMFGNGGSAADCDHIVGEFRNRFWYKRKAVNAISLSDSIATVTAIGNDFCFEDIFSRQLEGILEPFDSVIALSTSGRSKNVISAGKLLAKDFPDCNSLIITGLMDEDETVEGFKYHIQIPIEYNKYTVARIQEASMFLLHTLCGLFDSICEKAVDYAIGEIAAGISTIENLMGKRE